VGPVRLGELEPVPPDLVAQSRAFYAARGERRGPASSAELREARARATATAGGGVSVEGVRDPAGRVVPVRIAVPRTTAVRGVHLEIAGGGFTVNSAPTGDARNVELAEALGVVVVSPEHRLAPEDPWPAAPDDCAAVARWLLDHAATRFGAGNLTIGGSSAGATLAATTLLRSRDAGCADRFAGAVLRFGTYDLSGSTPAGRRIAGERFLADYVGQVADRTLPDVSPVFADLRGLPPVLVVVGADDVLLEDNLVMAARLVAAGVEVDLRVYPGAPHGFTGHATGLASLARDGVRSWLDGRLAAQR
jgi:acetyl esterase/lipase